ncbi:hypothetical protein ACH5RR_041722 [Cinchona calisaya]|uniref:DUF7890 domain-containing protein n=1 Tax=Cinchona calisaya TaxID=153742 RepID=A0ABD2XYD5_9GENT
MSSSLCSFINKNISKKNEVIAIYRDELDRKTPPEIKPKKKVRFETEPLIEKVDCESEKNKAPFKVKILMTKEEAARLLSKCKDGGVLELKDVASELVQIPINRVSLVSCSGNNKSSDLLLENIRKQLSLDHP